MTKVETKHTIPLLARVLVPLIVNTNQLSYEQTKEFQEPSSPLWTSRPMQDLLYASRLGVGNTVAFLRARLGAVVDAHIVLTRIAKFAEASEKFGMQLKGEKDPLRGSTAVLFVLFEIDRFLAMWALGSVGMELLGRLDPERTHSYTHMSMGDVLDFIAGSSGSESRSLMLLRNEYWSRLSAIPSGVMQAALQPDFASGRRVLDQWRHDFHDAMSFASSRNTDSTVISFADIKRSKKPSSSLDAWLQERLLASVMSYPAREAKA